MEQKLIALKVTRYNGQSLKPGDTFMAKVGHVRTLLAMRVAKAAEDEAPAAQPEVTDPVIATLQEAITSPVVESADSAADVVESEAVEAEDKSTEPAADAPKRRGRPPKAVQ